MALKGVEFTGYIPGAIGRVAELHGMYYYKHWGFHLFFESKVAMELSEFLRRFDEARDGFWVASIEERIIGSIAIDAIHHDREGAHLRWFIVGPENQGQGIGGVVGAKHQRRRWFQLFHQPPLFFQNAPIALGQEVLADFPVKFLPDRRIQSQLQGGEIVQRHRIDQFRCGVDVLLPVGLSAQSQDHRGGNGHSRFLCLVQTLPHGMGRRPLGDAFEQVRRTRFDAVIEQRQFLVPQVGQLRQGFFPQVSRKGVAGHALQPWERRLQGRQDDEQVVGGCRQGVAVSQKHPPHAGVGSAQAADFRQHVVQGPNRELFAAVHGAEAAAVETAPQGDLNDQIVALGRGAVEGHVVAEYW
ncbi:MAG: GNAT family N-acetyltransferase [Anaerolineales bacterium]|nr:GNAT family N-acetyltransferase [Anaerolineales bacterium]